MAVFHRFYIVFPLLALILLLGACSGGVAKRPWAPQKDTAQSQDTAPIPESQPSVKVAILLPLTGPNAATGQSMLQAAQLAVFDYGSDNFELISRDTGGTPQGASAAAQAVMNEGAQLILGPLLADEVRAVKSVTSGRGINVLAFSTDWTLAGDNIYIMGFLPFGQVDRIADFAASKGLKRAAVVAGTDVYGATVSSSFESRAQDKGITISRALSDPDGYDCVFIPAGGSALPNLLQRVANKNARKLGTGLWDDPRVAADPAMNGAWFAAPSPASRTAYEDRYQATYGKKPLRIGTLAYDATALAETLAQSGLAAGRGPAFDSTSLKSRGGFAGLDGIIRFDQSGLAERGLAILEIRNGQITEIDPAPAAFVR